jgi:SNF2 family DNA or RNA helicase
LVKGGTLVVCPTSLLHQWAREIGHKVHPAAACSVHVYHAKVGRLLQRCFWSQLCTKSTWSLPSITTPKQTPAQVRKCYV